MDHYKKEKRFALLEKREKFTGSKIFTHENIKKFKNTPEILKATNKIICGYYPMENEIDILPLLRYLGENNTILIPKTIKGSRVLAFGELDFNKSIDEQISQDNPYKIKEPINILAKDTLYIDYILVPALGVDKNFHRIGYGGGYYDNTLSFYQKINDSLVSVGICLSECYLEKEEFKTNEYDVSLMSLLTEKDFFSSC